MSPKTYRRLTESTKQCRHFSRSSVQGNLQRFPSRHARKSRYPSQKKMKMKRDWRQTARQDHRITNLQQSSAMPSPLLPLLTLLNMQLTVLAKPRHLDNISRRLQQPLSDLDRLADSWGHLMLYLRG